MIIKTSKPNYLIIMKEYLYFVTLFVLMCCPEDIKSNNDGVIQDRKLPVKTSVFHINLEESFAASKELKLSEVADSIQYLQLKTPKGIIISSIRQVIVTADFIYVLSKGTPYQFRRDGSFVRQIGANGKGPGEYIFIRDIALDESKKELVLFDIFQILYYKPDGHFIGARTFKINEPIAKTDDVIWTAITQPSGVFTELVVGFHPIRQDKLCEIPNYVLFRSKNKNMYTVSSKYGQYIYTYQQNLFFKGNEDNDTIWQLKYPKPEIHAILDMGKYKLPLKYRVDYSSEGFDKNAANYYGVPYVYEDERYFYYIAQPRNSHSTWFNYFPVVFDKRSGKGYLVKKGDALGMTDDLLQGPSFWPFFVSNNYMVNAVEAVDLMKQLQGTKSPYFKKLLSTINENSNQLLILCKKK